MKELIVELLPAWLSGDRRDQLLYVLALGLLVLGTGLCVVAVRVPVLDVLAAGAACAGAAAWLLTNAPGEGMTLLVVQSGNGLTVADLAVLPPGLLTGYLCVRRWRTPPCQAQTRVSADG